MQVIRTLIVAIKSVPIVGGNFSATFGVWTTFCGSSNLEEVLPF